MRYRIAAAVLLALAGLGAVAHAGFPAWTRQLVVTDYEPLELVVLSGQGIDADAEGHLSAILPPGHNGHITYRVSNVGTVPFTVTMGISPSQMAFPGGELDTMWGQYVWSPDWFVLGPTEAMTSTLYITRPIDAMSYGGSVTMTVSASRGP